MSSRLFASVVHRLASACARENAMANSCKKASFLPSFAFIARVVRLIGPRGTRIYAMSRSSWWRQHANEPVVYRTGEWVNKQRGEVGVRCSSCARETRSRSITNVANGRGVRYFRHGRSTWCHIFRTCRTDSPNTRPTTGGSLNGGALARLSPFLFFSPDFLSSFYRAVDGDECHCALRENVSTMYEVFRDAMGNRLYASLSSYRSLFSKRARWSASRKI